MFEPNRPLDTVMYLRVRAEEKEVIEHRAKKRNITPSALIREALGEWYKQATKTHRKRRRT